jgi:hypothetical protein
MKRHPLHHLDRFTYFVGLPTSRDRVGQVPPHWRSSGGQVEVLSGTHHVSPDDPRVAPRKNAPDFAFQAASGAFSKRIPLPVLREQAALYAQPPDWTGGTCGLLRGVGFSGIGSAAVSAGIFG